MIRDLTLLLIFQLVGEVTARGLGLSLPGPVLGLALFLVALIAVRGLAERTEATTRGLLSHLSLLFVPAGVGVVGHLGTLGAEGLPLMAAIVLSTALAIAVGALTFVGVLRLTGGGDD